MIPRSIALTASVLLALACVIAPPSAGSAAEELRILSISNLQGQIEALTTDEGEIGGAALLATHWQQERSVQPQTLALASGNSFGTSPPISNLFEDEPTVEAMNLIGFDADSLGNDNFDGGLARLQRLIDLAEFPYLAANLTNLEGNLNGIAPYRIFEMEQAAVAVIGLTDPAAPSLVFPGYFGSIEVTDPAEAARQARAAAAAEGATVFVVLTDIQVARVESATRATGPLLDLAGQLEGFDLILGSSPGGNFSTTVNGALVVGGEPQARSYARTSLYVEDGRVWAGSVAFVPVDGAGVTPDAEISALLASYREQLQESLSRIAGSSQAPITLEDACGDVEGTLCESTAGNVVADALRLTYGTDFALVNGGSLRADLTCPAVDDPNDFCPDTAGLRPIPISEGRIQALLPFRNLAVTATISGADLKAMLEHGLSALPEVHGRFPQVSGLCFAYDIARPPGERLLAAVRQGEDGSCDGAPIDLSAAATYTLATNEFILAGGDGYVLNDPEARALQRLDAVLALYLERASPLSPGIEGRSVCLSTGDIACPPSSGPGASQALLDAIAGSPPPSIRPPSTGDGGLISGAAAAPGVQ